MSDSKGIKIYTNEKGMKALQPKQEIVASEKSIEMYKKALKGEAEKSLIEAIQEDMDKDGIKMSEAAIKAQVDGAVAEREQVEATKDEQKLMLEYQKIFIESGNNHRRARRVMDKKYGHKRMLTFGSWKQK